jgi:hypothetical protein
MYVLTYLSCTCNFHLCGHHKEVGKGKIHDEHIRGCPQGLRLNSNTNKQPKYALIKKKKIFLIYKEIQSGAVAKSYLSNGFLIYEQMRKYLVIYEEAVIVICDFATAPF